MVRRCFYRHFRTAHSHLCASDGSCPRYGVPAVQKRNRMPPEFTGKLLAEEWLWLRHKVANLVAKDEKKFAGGCSDVDAITLGVARDLVERQLIHTPCHDDAGGYLPNGFILHPHALFQLSLDRLNTELPHFIDQGRVRANVSFVALGINTCACIVSSFEGDVCRMLRGWVNDKGPIDVKHARLCCRHNFYRDAKCADAFADVASFSAYCGSLLEEQRGECAISGIRLVGSGGVTWRRMSLDAIDPCKGHVRGNLRWVAMFLNSVCNDKRRLYQREGDEPTQWTSELYRQYIGAE